MNTGYESLRTGCAWLNLTPRGKIRVTGEDAGRLLHAMSTNNVKDLAPGHGIYAFFLTDKGRIMSDANIFRLGNEYWLDTEPEGAAVLYLHLDKYIIADDAAVDDETKRWFTVGIEGPESSAAMERLGVPIPPQPLDILTFDLGYVARVASTGLSGFRVWASQEHQVELSNRLSSIGLPQATADEAKTVRLENGIPRFGDDITERYLVQETQQLRAVSFTKGCYLGQEIVERVRSQGKVHRLLTAIRIHGPIPPPPGTKLTWNESAAAGEITSAIYSPALKQVAALAYLRSEVLEKHSDMLIAGTDPALQAQIADLKTVLS